MLPIFHKRGYENGALKVRFQETGIPGTHKRPQGQGWAMDPEGYSYVTFTRPTSPHFYQGIALKNGAMYVSTVLSDDDYRVGGLRIGRDGALKVSAASAASEGLLIASDGTLAVAGLSFFAPLSDLGAGEVDLGILGTGSATFTRATTATTINSAGLIIPVASGVPRSWYWPDTLAYGGYLAEGARTNLLLRSEEFDNASWSKTDTTVTANNTTSPDGTANADLLTQGTAGTAIARQAVTVTADVSYAASCWFKRGNTDWIFFGISSAADATDFARAWFNVNTGVVGTSAAGGDGTLGSVRITAHPNGWYRAQVCGSVGGGATSVNTNIIAVDADNSFTRTVAYTYYAWGAQFENNCTFASSYIPTTTASVTRNADVLTYVFAGNADATQGTAYAELGTEWGTTTSTHIAVGFQAASTGPLFVANAAATTIRMSDGTAVSNKTGLTDMATASRKRASAWGGSTQSVTGDGATVATAAFDGDIGSTDIGIGNDSSGARNWFGPIKNVAIMDSQFTSQQLVDMTA